MYIFTQGSQIEYKQEKHSVYSGSSKFCHDVGYRMHELSITQSTHSLQLNSNLMMMNEWLEQLTSKGQPFITLSFSFLIFLCLGNEIVFFQKRKKARKKKQPTF